LFIDTARAAGLHVDVIYEQRAFQLSILGAVQQCIQQRDPHIVETNAIKSHFVARLLGLRRRYRWIACHHGYVTTNSKVGLYNQLDRWSLPAAHHVFTVCQPFSRELQHTGVRPDRITVRHNMIHPPAPPPAHEIAALRARLGIEPGTRIIFTAGRLSREKGHLDLVEATALLRDAGDLPPFCIVVAGEGPERRAIEKRCGELRLTNFLLAGHQPDVRAWYAAANVFVLPSHSEGSPMALLEAMATGLPVVATNVGGVAEIARADENAVLVPGRDSRALAEGIRRVLLDPGLSARLGGMARRVTSEFDSATYCRTTLDVYRRVMRSSGR
jgi:glycosyltransferase involved in cell wall biosynthesis